MGRDFLAMGVRTVAGAVAEPERAADREMVRREDCMAAAVAWAAARPVEPDLGEQASLEVERLAELAAARVAPAGVQHKGLSAAAVAALVAPAMAAASEEEAVDRRECPARR